MGGEQSSMEIYYVGRYPARSSSFTATYVVCIILPFIPDVRLVDVPAGVIQEEGYTHDFLIHLPFGVLALIFLVEMISRS